MSMEHDVTKTVRLFCAKNGIDDEIAFNFYNNLLDDLEWMNFDAKTEEEEKEYRRDNFFSHEITQHNQ